MSSKTVLEQIRAESRAALSSALGFRPRKLILLDIPRHRNLGDSLIWAGQLQYFSELGCEVIYEADHSQYSLREISRLDPSAVIMLQGGGNFGSLYPEHHQFRLRVIRENPSREIVQLPQSAYFGGEVDEVTAATMESHPALTVFVRDGQSLRLLNEQLPGTRIRFCHDMALGLRASERPEWIGPGSRIVCVARNDKEATAADSKFAGLPDWSNGGWMNNSLWHSARLVGGLFRRLPTPISIRNRVLRGLNRVLLELNLRAAIRGYQESRAVVTNRLHGHVLACLLGLPSFISDNSYGKISALIDASTARLNAAKVFDSLESAMLAARNDAES
ncbi:polysaccharide pyruvyl transferase family protein [Microbacterium sp. NPDC055312]